MAKKQSLFTSLKEFKLSILIFKNLISNDIAKIRINSEGFIDINLDEQRFERLGKVELDKAKLKTLLNTEIPITITASLKERPHAFLRMILPGKEYDEKKKIRDDFDKKIDLIRNEVITDQIKERALLREVSKNNILDEVRWDIGFKCHDLQKGSLNKFHYATIQFICNKPSFISPMCSDFFVIPPARKLKILSLDIHLEDIEYLIEDLSVLRDNLKKISEKK